MTETSSAYEQMLTMAAALTFSDKLRFNSEFAALLKKDGKTGPVGKAAKKEKSESKKSSGTKRKSVWFAFVKQLKETMPERFADVKGGPAQNTVAKLIKNEDLATYEAYAAKFKLENGSSSASSVVTDAESSSSEAEAEAAPSSSSVAEPVQDKKAALAAAMAAKKAAAAAAKLPASPKPSKEEKAAAKEAEKTAKAAAKEAEKAAKAAEKEAAKAAKPKKEPKKVAAKAAAAAPVVAEAEVTMPKLTIAGTTYWHDESSNGLYAVEADDSFGAWVGFFQPGDEETPIRYTDSPADE
jgi:hypothetical protein